jgi:hypothetical protein
MNKTSTLNLTASQLRQAATLADEIEAKQNQLTALLSGGTNTLQGSNKGAKTPPGHRKFSPTVRAKIAAGQKARWARVHAAQNGNGSATKPVTADIPEGAEAVRMVAPAVRA